MSVTIELPEPVLSIARRFANRDGRRVEDYLAEVISGNVSENDASELASATKELSFAELCMPINRRFEESGQSEDELTAAIDRELQAVRAEAGS